MDTDKEIDLTVSQARAYFDDGDLGEDFENALDEVQGEVGINKKKARLIINIIPDTE